MNISSYSTIESYECTNKSTILHGRKEEYTTSVQSFKPALDSYQTSTRSIDRTSSQPDSYRTVTTASDFNSQPVINSQPFSSLPFQRKTIIDTSDSQENQKSVSRKNRNQHALKDCEQDFESGHDFCDNAVPPFRRHPPRFNPQRRSERMPKLPSRRYSSPPFYETRQQDLSDYCDDIQSNYQRQIRDSESRYHNGSIRYSPFNSRGRSDNILRRHSLRGRHERRPSFSSFEASRDFNCDQDYYETSQWNY